MHKVWLLAKREYIERVRTKAFLIFTLLTPALMFAFTVLPGKMMTMRSGENQHLVVVTSDAGLGQMLQQRITEDLKKSVKSARVDVSTETSDSAHEDLRRQVDTGAIGGFLWATNDAIASGTIPYNASSTSDFIQIASIEHALQDAVIQQRLGSHGLSSAEVVTLLKPVKLDAQEIHNGRLSKTDQDAAVTTGLFMLMLMYMTVLIYGMNVMRSVLEEKTSRILEVLLSSVTAKELMAAKILGVGAVGLTQIAIWAGLSLLYIVPAALAAGSAGVQLHLSGGTFIAFGVFFILGYLLYSALCGALGATVSSDQEAQQVNFVVAMPLILSLVFGFYVMRQPDAPLSVVLSLIPFCTPMLMLLRIVLKTPPLWQIGLSIFLMVATTYGMLVLCSKIYRVGILMYGKRPTLPEILKWLKYT